MCYTRLHLFEIFVGIILPPNIWAGYVTASFTWNGLFSPFRAESILVVTSGISHEVFVLFRATNHESVV